MYTTRTPFGLHWPFADQPVDARLKWLVAANAAENTRVSRLGLEEELMMMRRPIDIKRAYGIFGLLLGGFPSAAIFYRMFGDALTRREFELGLFLLLLGMNIACWAAGSIVASRLSGMAETIERDSWMGMLVMPLMLGLIWGVGAGAAGGFIFFGIGAFFGALCAIPVGLVAFALFMPLHRLLARGGMIEAGHLWPLACGVTLTLSALILGF
ncbi:MAG TPA: hypothetical protein VGX92_09335 [Pyrinomonadaceae bacterium]|jgi:hypothetical protein|nr:hypothetical protein [Pyrinomonadaceae bacterium]